MDDLSLVGGEGYEEKYGWNAANQLIVGVLCMHFLF